MGEPNSVALRKGPGKGEQGARAPAPRGPYCRGPRTKVGRVRRLLYPSPFRPPMLPCSPAPHSLPDSASAVRPHKSVQQLVGSIDLSCLRWCNVCGRAVAVRCPRRTTAKDPKLSLGPTRGVGLCARAALLACCISPSVIACKVNHPWSRLKWMLAVHVSQNGCGDGASVECQ